MLVSSLPPRFFVSSNIEKASLYICIHISGINLDATTWDGRRGCTLPHINRAFHVYLTLKFWFKLFSDFWQLKGSSEPSIILSHARIHMVVSSNSCLIKCGSTGRGKSMPNTVQFALFEQQYTSRYGMTTYGV